MFFNRSMALFLEGFIKDGYKKGIMTGWLTNLLPNALVGDKTLQKNFFIALSLCAIPSSIAIGVTVYCYSLFLSSYPNSWIPYWMFGDAITTFLLGNALSLYTPRNAKRYTQMLLLGMSGVVFCLFMLSQLSWYWAPFIIVLILKACSSMTGVLIWSMISTFFYYRQFKKIFNRFSISASLAAIVAPLFYAWLSHFLNLSSVLGCLILLLITGCVLTSYAVPIVTESGEQQNKHRHSVSPVRYPLFRTLLLITLLLSIISLTAEFLFRSQLEMNFDKEQIATFVSFFLLSINVFSLGLQFLTPQVFARFKFYVVLQCILLIIALASLVYWVMPSLWPIVFLNGIETIFGLGWVSMISKSVINIFPPAMIMKSELLIKSFANPLGMAVAATLALLSTHVPFVLNYLPLIIVSCAVVGIALAHILFKRYFQALKDMIMTTGLSLSIRRNPEERKNLQTLILDTLQKPNVKPIEVALITPKLFDHPPSILYQLLKEHNKVEIQQTVINVLNQYPANVLDSKTLISLPHRATLSGMVRDSLYKLLSNVHSDVLLKDVRNTLEKEPATKNALLVLLKTGNTSDYIFAVHVTSELAQSTEVEKRIMAAKLLHTLGAGRLYDLKNKLLTDKEPSIRFTAFHHLPAQDVLHMLPALGRFLNRNAIRILHQRFDSSELITLSRQLINLYQEKPEEYTQSAIAFIIPIPDDRLESYVIDFLSLKDNYHRHAIALQLLERKKEVTLSKALKQKLVHAMNFEVTLIKQYRLLLTLPGLQSARPLLHNRVYYARQRFLYWYTAYNERTLNVLSSLSKINPYHLTRKNKSTQDKAIELFIANEKKASIYSLIETAFDDIPLSGAQPTPRNWRSILTNDPWLFDVLSHHSLEGNHEMNALQRAIALQQTEFFESLPDEVLFELGHACEFLDCAPEQLIIKEGDEGNSLYILIEGKVAVYKGDALLTTIEPFQCFGEMALIDDESKRTSTVIAQERSILLVLEKTAFLAITNEFPQILRTIIKIISQRFLGQIAMLENKLNALDSPNLR